MFEKLYKNKSYVFEGLIITVLVYVALIKRRFIKN